MSHDITQFLAQMEAGDSQAAERLLPLVYDELRHLAAAKLGAEKPGQTLQATALVHEAFLRLQCGHAAREFNGRAHFFAVAAEAMRRILVDQARRKASHKHGGLVKREHLELNEISLGVSTDEILHVHEALDSLTVHDRQAAELVKLHYFSGFSIEEAAELLGLSRATGYRLWTYARAWLRAALQDSAEPMSFT
jgi:RNA polymerase sigma factor (TIGR02999 family)